MQTNSTTNLYFKEPTIEDRIAVEEMKKEFLDSDKEIVGDGRLMRSKSFDEFLEFINARKNKESLPANSTVCSYFLSYRKADKKLIGAINIRHSLLNIETDSHIGYCVRPSERKKGYAYEQLKMVLLYCRDDLGLNNVVIVCDKSNIASKNLIKKVGGVLDKEFVVDNKQKCRYIVVC